MNNKFKGTNMVDEDILEVVSGNTATTYQFKQDITQPKDTFIGFYSSKEIKDMLFLAAGLAGTNISQYLTKLIVTDLNKNLRKEKISKAVAIQKQKDFEKVMSKASGPKAKTTKKK